MRGIFLVKTKDGSMSAKGLKKRFYLPIEEVLELLPPALAKEGFGVLTEIDMAATLKAKLGVERAPYRILGACNPELANRAIEADPEIGLMLPCNVIVYEEGDFVNVHAVDPNRILGNPEEGEMKALADEVKERLSRAINSLSGPVS